MTTDIRRLYKSRTDRMIDGVCGGIANYFKLDPTLVRVVWVLLTLLGGSGLVLYIAAMILMPKEPYTVPNYANASSERTPSSASGEPSKKNSLFWGVLLICVGLLIFLHNIGVSVFHPFWWFDSDIILPTLLILAGVAFMWGGRNSLAKNADAPTAAGENVGDTSATSAVPPTEPRRLYRSFLDSKLFGVCGGIGSYFGVDSTIVRILFVIGVFVSSGLFVIGYVIMAILIPKETPSYKIL